ncbi:AI-2E family transporter [Maribacter halichondriae]|uniref:AI-2E family transporter n=1 Tax=Maribacter halichondriae TaxID=2980554 RepID=UPI002359AF1F|nr:AI-2E family transporter [Maribacter sp. Hal144]
MDNSSLPCGRSTFNGSAFFFFNQSRILFGELPSVRDRLNSVATESMGWFDQQFELDPKTSFNWVSENLLSVLDLPLGLLQESFQSGTTILVNTVLISLITYFMLLYRKAFKNFFLSQINPKYRETTEHLFDQLQKLTKRYMIGQGLIVVILGVLIGSGLWLIGVPYPFFWGFLAGFLEIIPYVGTTIGGILPFTYMLMVADTLWQPWAVLILYIIVQQIEGNLISPNVMGSSIKVNPLFIITGLFLGGFIWGVSGMILVLPVLAISKEVFRSFDVLAPLSYLMEDGLSRKSNVFLEEFDSSEYRFFHVFFEEKGDGKEKKKAILIIET